MFGKILSVLAVGYTGWVEYEKARPYLTNYFNGEMKKDAKFDVGSIDDRISDELHTGDIILYSRRWYHNHLPMALFIQLYQLVFDCYFDHAGVVILDPTNGTPYVLELSQFGHPTLTKYSNLILLSTASQINILPIQPTFHFADSSRLRFEDFMEEIIKTDKVGSEFGNMMSFFKDYFSRKYMKVKSPDNEPLLCPSSRLVYESYKKLGVLVTIVGHRDVVTLADVVDNNWRLRCDKGVCEKKFNKSGNFGPSTVVRLR